MPDGVLRLHNHHDEIRFVRRRRRKYPIVPMRQLIKLLWQIHLRRRTNRLASNPVTFSIFRKSSRFVNILKIRACFVKGSNSKYALNARAVASPHSHPRARGDTDFWGPILNSANSLAYTFLKIHVTANVKMFAPSA